MITDAIAHSSRYAALHPDFAEAFRLLQSLDLAALPDGQVPCGNPNIRLFIQTETLRAREAALPEAHLNHIDIQVPLNGRETYGWIDRSHLQHGQGYNEERDIEFFRCTPETWFDLEIGEFALFFPNDGHAPLVGTPGQTIRKAVFKIRSADCRID